MSNCTYVATAMNIIFSMHLELILYFAFSAAVVKIVNRIF